MSVSVLQQAKIQAQVLFPLVKTLQAELGESAPTPWFERRCAISIAATARSSGRRRMRRIWEGYDVGFRDLRSRRALDYEVKEQSQDAFDLNVTGCRYAEFYKALGAPELGFLLVCSADYHMAEGFGPEIKLTRMQTIMQGASHCDFRYRRSQEKD